VRALPEANAQTNGIQLSVATGTSSSLTYDLNGNMTSDGTNSYSWDAEDRLIQITYPGSGNNSQFSYDPWGRNVTIQEYSGGSLVSTKQFVWCAGTKPREARDASSNVTAQYFSLGETISGTGYVYDLDILGSVREMTNSSGAVQSQYTYDPYGQVTKLQGSLAADMQYAGYYQHAASGLSLTRTRAYRSSLARFINRDAIGEHGGLNLYDYVSNKPVTYRDPLGFVGETYTNEEIIGWVGKDNMSQLLSNAFIICQIWQESSFKNLSPISRNGPAGLMQISAGAVTDVRNASGIPFTYSQWSDPGINIQIGTFYDDIEIKKAGGDVALAMDLYGTGHYAGLKCCEKCVQEKLSANGDITPCLYNLHKP